MPATRSGAPIGVTIASPSARRPYPKRSSPPTRPPPHPPRSPHQPSPPSPPPRPALLPRQRQPSLPATARHDAGERLIVVRDGLELAVEVDVHGHPAFVLRLGFEVYDPLRRVEH